MGLAEMAAAAAAQPLAKELLDTFKKMAKDMEDVKAEFAARKALPITGPILVDQHITITVPAGEEKTVNIFQEVNRVGASATVIQKDAANTVELGLNGSDTFPVSEGDELDNCIIASLRLDNSLGTTDLKVLVFLAASRAVGAGAWA